MRKKLYLILALLTMIGLEVNAVQDEIEIDLNADGKITPTKPSKSSKQSSSSSKVQDEIEVDLNSGEKTIKNNSNIDSENNSTEKNDESDLKVTAENSKNDQSQNEVEIDLNNHTMTSTEGLNVRYGNIMLKAFNARLDENNNIVVLPGDFYLEANNPGGKLKIEGKDGRFVRDQNVGNMGPMMGYLQVGSATGAEAPNDKIYFGGEKSEYKNDNVYITNAWFTTDPKVVQTGDPNNAGYHLQADSILVEPDKQVTFKGNDLFIGKRDVIPFSFPWYRVNIRNGSEVPLFPEWGNKDEYGWYITSGFLYGNKDSKFKGGFAPKFGDRIGWMVGRMENWYDFGKYGQSKFNIKDWLVVKKADSSDVERNFDRWDMNYTHRYSGEYGHLDLGYRNATYNMISSMDDAIDDYFAGNWNKNRPGNSWKYIDGIPNKGGNIGFYNVNTDLKNMGANKDISLKADVNLVSDRDAYSIIMLNQLDDMDYGSTSDYDLNANVSLNKENDRYSVGGYYRYLHDMDKGSNPNDLQSRAEDYGFHVQDKIHKINISYDEKNGDKYRRLNSWERDPNFSKLNDHGAYGINYDYTPWTVSQYDQYDSRNLKASLGKYKLRDDVAYQVNYDYDFIEHKLNEKSDPFRKTALLDGHTKTDNLRDVQYNRYENIIYNKKTENKAGVDLYYGDTKWTVAGGTTKEQIWDREGIYDKKAWDRDSYKIYENDSNFFETALSNENIGLGQFGNLELYGNVRLDQYTNGYDDVNDKKISTDDQSMRTRFGFTHDVALYDNTTDPNRDKDKALRNTLSYMNQHYTYNGGGDISKDVRMKHKENINQVTDKVQVEYGNTTTTYTIDYKNTQKASNGKKKGEILNQKADFVINDKNAIGIEYNTDKRYTDENTKHKTHNDLTYNNYGISYDYKDNKFYYKKREINADIKDIKNVADAKENIDEDVYGYTRTFGENKLDLQYISGKDRRKERGDKVIDTKNDSYSVAYLNGGEVEHYFKGTYEKYKNAGDWNSNLSNYNSDVIYLGYSYRDKRFTDKELAEYAASEYNKKPNELSSEEIDRVRRILQDRENLRASMFNVNRIIDDKTEYFGDYKRGFNASIMMQRNDERYRQTGNYFDSLEELEGRLFYSYNRIGLGYIYNQKSGWTNYSSPTKWVDNEREHEFSLHAKVGKPSEGWRTKAYVKFLDQLHGRGKDGRSTFDGFGIELGKEFGYYEWAVAYERDYSYRTKDYEWNAALQFKLLTFPNMNIFGLGAGADKDGKVSPKSYLFNGIKVKDM